MLCTLTGVIKLDYVEYIFDISFNTKILITHYNKAMECVGM